MRDVYCNDQSVYCGHASTVTPFSSQAMLALKGNFSGHPHMLLSNRCSGSASQASLLLLFTHQFLLPAFPPSLPRTSFPLLPSHVTLLCPGFPFLFLPPLHPVCFFWQTVSVSLAAQTRHRGAPVAALLTPDPPKRLTHSGSWRTSCPLYVCVHVLGKARSRLKGVFTHAAGCSLHATLAKPRSFVAPGRPRPFTVHVRQVPIRDNLSDFGQPSKVRPAPFFAHRRHHRRMPRLRTRCLPLYQSPMAITRSPPWSAIGFEKETASVYVGDNCWYRRLLNCEASYVLTHRYFWNACQLRQTKALGLFSLPTLGLAYQHSCCYFCPSCLLHPSLFMGKKKEVEGLRCYLTILIIIESSPPSNPTCGGNRI